MSSKNTNNTDATYNKEVEENAAIEQEEAEVNAAEESVEEADVVEASDQVAELERQVDENYQRMLRVQADFDNFRRRTVKEKEDFAKYASAKLVEQLLPLLDNFERALAVAVPDAQGSNSFVTGIEMIYRQMAQILEAEGLKPIASVGQPFNPEYHQAIMREEAEDQEEGIILEELQKGYMIKDKVLRPSMVKVSG